MSNWTQAICPDDWDLQYPDRPFGDRPRDLGPEEICCYCGEVTRAGIYVRVDPATVPFAQEENR